jgi:type II restriction enzyme
MFDEFVSKIITASAELNFTESSKRMVEYVDAENNFMDLLDQIGVIPESIDHDSTEEKLFAKASDAVLARAFREIGLKATVITERADAADVVIESKYHDYTMVADAKAFRLSRTAKNQKDFKVVALSGWRQDADYAVLCSPYFQYPSNQSQIYAQSIDHNVCLLGWEHLVFLIRNGIKEDVNFNLSNLWSFGEDYSHKVIAAERKKCFLEKFNSRLVDVTNLDIGILENVFMEQIVKLSDRAVTEKQFWENEKKKIEGYSKEQAIRELIISKKIDEKIIQIGKYIGRLVSV